jgi:glycosyltransferase involved in cell wall biosynthesis
VHRDDGNTPWCFGAISARNQGFDAVAYLDSDNWYAPDRIASLADLCRRQDPHVTFSEHHIVMQDDG